MTATTERPEPPSGRPAASRSPTSPTPRPGRRSSPTPAPAPAATTTSSRRSASRPTTRTSPSRCSPTRGTTCRRAGSTASPTAQTGYPLTLDQAQGVGRRRARARARPRHRRRQQVLNWPAHGWHEFRDPNEEWEQTIYRYNANVVRQLNQNIENARNAQGVRAVDPELGPLRRAQRRRVDAHRAHPRASTSSPPTNRSGPTNMHNTAMAVNSAHKIRFAQDLALYNLTLSRGDRGLRRRRPRRRVEQRRRVAGCPQAHRGADGRSRTTGASRCSPRTSCSSR